MRWGSDFATHSAADSENSRTELPTLRVSLGVSVIALQRSDRYTGRRFPLLMHIEDQFGDSDHDDGSSTHSLQAVVPSP